MSIRKNTASQKWLVFAFTRSTSEPKTGDAANITAKLRQDSGSATAVTDTNPTEIEDGFYEFDLSQAETNADVLDFLPESSSSGVQVIGVPGRVWTVSTTTLTASAIADQVWDEVGSGHETAGTTGYLLKILSAAANGAVNDTVAFSTAGLLSVDEFLLRCDWTTVAELVTDTAHGEDPTLPTEGSLSTNDKLAAALLDASGMVESAAYSSGRYNLSTLEALEGSALGLVYQLISQVTVCLLYDRRPRSLAGMPPPGYYQSALWEVQSLSGGNRLFG